MANEKGKKLLADLAGKVKEKVTPDGEPELHARGQGLIEELATELATPGAFPGLRVFRDGADRFKLQRPARNGEIVVGWQRAIGAIVAQVFRGERREAEMKYLWDAPSQEWRRMEGRGELYEDVTKWLGDVLYPEIRR